MEFANLQGATITAQSTAVFTFYDLPGEPWLRVKPGGDINRPYFAEVLASSSKQRRRLMKGKVDAEMLDQNRQLDRKLYPKHIDGGDMGGWDQMLKGKRVPVNYSPAAFTSICEKLPADLFDELRGFCNEPANFRAEEEPGIDDIEETAKN